MVKLKLFEAFGIEAEYMIVKKDSLDVQPIAHEVLARITGEAKASKLVKKKIAWSNELALHVLEIKCAYPLKNLVTIYKEFSKAIRAMNKALLKFDCQLMPTAMHPWMNPKTETQLWPYGQKRIYRKFDEIFNCSGHGWSNLQSVHINLPFSNDEEFGRLHAAIRVVLPLIPYLSASSPYYDGKKTNLACNRLDFYQKNQQKIPLIAGDIIPEPIFSKKEYLNLLARVYSEIRPFDPKGIICHTWVNSRGVIPKFDDGALEIRLMDIQECPLNDFALIALIVLLVKNIAMNLDVNLQARQCETKKLKQLLLKAMTYQEFQVPQWYQRLFLSEVKALKISDFMKKIIMSQLNQIDPVFHKPLKKILQKGNLSKRLISHPADLKSKYQRLLYCLDKDEIYEPKK